jgi:hypothetical protein
MGKVVPGPSLLALIEQAMHLSSLRQPPMAASTKPRIHFWQQSHGLSDTTMKDALSTTRS